MPGIVDDLVTPELAWVVGDHLVAQQNDDAFGMVRVEGVASIRMRPNRVRD